MRKLVILVAMVMSFAVANAQRDLMLSQQFFSRLNANPAATGNSDDIDFFLLGRWQWIGVEDSPKSGVLNISDYFESVRSGIGLTVSYDDVGISNKTTIAKAAYAYHINVNENMLLSMGLSAGILYHYWNPEQHRLQNPEEFGQNTFPNEIVTSLEPDMDFGLELATPRLLFGASVDHLLNNDEDVTTSKPGRQFYWYVRTLFPLGESIDFAPAIIYMHRNTVDRAELNLFAYFERTLWGGITYRPDINAEFSSNMLTFTLGLEYKRYRFGYSFEWGLGEISELSSNSSEFLISYRLPKKMKNKYVRFMED
ncbi:MAG: PorP/SprF family type IX secretion system membrane protein [Paludibacteraceae bacterium]|nr:PorP/SprF family type IX secretion system membrane protein [Paludibacteraceae bacterium]MBR4838845.1 PorP/SprF family type IX secretion system membrane protein [Paludibacteraceae bacterium]